MSRPSPGWSPLIVGAGLTAMDLLLSFRFQGVTRPPAWPLRLSLLLAVPAALMTLVYSVRLLGRLGPLLTGIALGAWIGYVAGGGAHARTLPLADWWSPLAAVLGGAVAVGVPYARRRAPRRTRILLGAAGIIVTLLAAFSYRGLYVDLRAATATWGAVLLVAAAWPITGPSAGPKGRRLALVTAALWLAAWPGLARPEARAWARRACTAAAVPARLVGRWFPHSPPAADHLTWSPPPYFATPLHRRVQAALGQGKDRPRGVFLIVIDALRADAVDEANTPHLLRWSRKGLLARRAHSPSAASHLTLVSALSGLYPNQLAAMDDGWNSVPLVTERLNAHGVMTRAFFPPVIHNLRSPGFRRMDLGFQALESRDRRLGDPTPREVARLLFPTRANERWFSYLHVMAPHAPYDSGDAPEGATDRERYLAEVRAADALVDRVLVELTKAGLAESTWVVVTADHGEEFGEHGGIRHSTQLYEESIHVPLVILGPKVRPRTVDALVSLADLAPTLDDFFALSSDDGAQYAGRSWAPLALDLEDPDRPAFVLASLPPLESDFLPTTSAVIEGWWKLIVEEREGNAQLYDLAGDPRETRNVAREHPRVLARMWGLSKALRTPGRSVNVAAPKPPTELLPKDLEVLEDPDLARRNTLLLPLRWGDLEPARVLRLLALFVRDGDPEIAIILEKAYTRLAERTRGVAQALFRWVLEKDRPEDAQKLIAFFRNSKDPFIQSSILASFGRRKDNRLLDVPRKAPVNTALVADLAEAGYRVLFGKTPDEELVRRGLAHAHPWVRRLALEVVAADPRDDGARLERALEDESSSPMMRITALRGLVRRGRWEPILAATRVENPAVAEEALGLFFTSGTTRPEVRTASLDVDLTPKAFTLDMGDIEEGSVIALMARGAPILLPRPTLHWARGSTLGKVEIPRGPHLRAVRIRVPPGGGRITLRFPGRPGDVRLGGWIVIPPTP